MKFKKLASLAMVAALSVSTLAGCGGSGNNGGGGADKGAAEESAVSLKIWVPEEEVDITDQMVKDFDAAHDEFDIDYEIAITGIDEAPSALETDADTAADIFYVPSGNITDLESKGLLLPITKGVDEIKADLPDAALDAVVRNDEMYAVPFSPNTYFMYYNKKLYNEDELKSLDTMMAKDLGEGMFNFSTQISNSWYIESFFLGAGCTLFGEDGMDAKDCTFNNENGVAAGEYIIDLVNNPKYIEDADSAGGAAFKEGKLGAVTSGAWSRPEFEEALGDDLGAVALPTAKIGGKDVQLSNFVDFKTVAVKSNTKYPLAAQQLAAYMANPESCMTRYKEQGDVPVLKSLTESDEITADFVASALSSQAALATNQPSIPEMANYWDPAKALGEGIVSGDITKKNLKAQLDSLVDSILSSLDDSE